MKVDGARLRNDNGQHVEFIRSPNQSAGLDRRFLILHYTAGLTAQSAIEWFKNRGGGRVCPFRDRPQRRRHADGRARPPRLACGRESLGQPQSV